MERKKGFDVARGIGIFLIVWSHTMSDGEPLRSFLFSFHVPLFFLREHPKVCVNLQTDVR